MITEQRTISPALASLYAAMDHRERLETLVGASERVQEAGIELYRHHRRRADNEAAFVAGEGSGHHGHERERFHHR